MGFYVFDVQTGKKITEVTVPGLNSKQVLLSYGDKQIMCLYENEKQSYIRVYDTDKALAGGKQEPIVEIAAPVDLVFTKAVWGPKKTYGIRHGAKIVYLRALSSQE